MIWLFFVKMSSLSPSQKTEFIFALLIYIFGTEILLSKFHFHFKHQKLYHFDKIEK